MFCFAADTVYYMVLYFLCGDGTFCGIKRGTFQHQDDRHRFTYTKLKYFLFLKEQSHKKVSQRPVDSKSKCLKLRFKHRSQKIFQGDILITKVMFDPENLLSILHRIVKYQFLLVGYDNQGNKQRKTNKQMCRVESEKQLGKLRKLRKFQICGYMWF